MMNEPKQGDRALVNGEPCVRVRVGFTSNSCIDCPLYLKDGRYTQLCDSSCGTKHVWVREIVYITELLEGNAASL